MPFVWVTLNGMKPESFFCCSPPAKGGHPDIAIAPRAEVTVMAFESAYMMGGRPSLLLFFRPSSRVKSQRTSVFSKTNW